MVKTAKTAPLGSRKQSAVKATVNGSARSLHGKRVGAKPQTQVQSTKGKKIEKSAQKLTTPMKKRDEKLAEKEQKSTAKKMTNKEFTKFCAEVQAAGVSASAMPKMADKVDKVSLAS